MDQSQRKEVEQKIHEEISRTEASVDEYKELTKPIEPENAIGRISRMDAINNKAVNDKSLREAQEKLKKLKYMLTQIDEKGFGCCARCGKQIPLGRIMLMPHSRFCVNCAG